MEDTILSFLFNSTILFSILFAGVWLIKKAFSRHLSALLQYILWIVVIVKLVLPVGLPSELSPWNLFGSSGETPAISQTAQADLTENAGSGPARIPGMPPQYPAGLPDSAGGQQVQEGDPAQTVENTGSGAGRINWCYTAIYVWISGMLAMLGWMIICAAQIRWKIASNGTEPIPGWALRVFEECGRELGIKRKIRLAVQHVFPVPAITGVIKPVLILPVETLSGKDAGKMKHILLHELTHYKKGDIIVTYLLNILNAVYWFNPLVWVCCGLVRKDMEILCDNRVIGRIGKENRQNYIETVLQFSLKKHTPGLNPAMSLGDGRIAMQKRIMGMFMRKQTKTRIKIPVLLLCIVIIFTCFTTACQPTPKNQPVVGRVDLEKKVEQIAAPAVKYDAPGTWQEKLDMQGSDMPVAIDAAVNVPEAGAYPVYKARQADFTQDQINMLLKYFLKDKKVIKNPVMTKADYEKQIVEAKRGQLIDGKYVVTGESEAWVAELEQRMAEAPETGEKEYLTDLSLKKGEPAFGMVELGNGKYGRISFSESAFSYNNGSFSLPESQMISMGKEGIKETFRMTEEEAEKAAQKTLDALGVTGMAPASIEKAYFYSLTNFETDIVSENENPASKGYYIKYVREIDEIPTELIESWSFSGNETFSYIPPWEAEIIRVYVDDSGNVQQFDWFAPLRVTDKVSDNAGLMPFADMQDRMRRQLRYTLSPMGGSGLYATVDRIELKTAMINIRDNPDEAMFVPAWYIHYTIHQNIQNYGENGDNQKAPMEDRRIIVLDAIDGGSVSTASAVFLQKINAASESTEEAQLPAEPAAGPAIAPVPESAIELSAAVEEATAAG